MSYVVAVSKVLYSNFMRKQLVYVKIRTDGSLTIWLFFLLILLYDIMLMGSAHSDKGYDIKNACAAILLGDYHICDSIQHAPFKSGCTHIFCPAGAKKIEIKFS